MKITALFLAIPLSLGSGIVLAEQVTTSSETIVSKPAMPSVETKSSEHVVTPDGATIEKHSASTENADGSKTSEKSKTIVRP
jgi:hypothetical protein